jgi:hypothetical protein
MSQPTASAVFTIDELWLLQSVIRHEAAQMDSWRFPPASLALNDQIAEVLLRCEEFALGEAALVLTRGDCLAIDHNVPQGAKSPAGIAVGKSVLLKSFRVRRELDEGVPLMAPVDAEAAQSGVDERLEQWKNRRRRKRSS